MSGSTGRGGTPKAHARSRRVRARRATLRAAVAASFAELEVVEVAAGFAACFAARIGLLGLAEPLPRLLAIATQLEDDPLAEQRARVLAVHRQRLVELGLGLLQLAVREQRLALLHEVVGVGDEL